MQATATASYVKLPNERIAEIDSNGFISAVVEMDLSEFISRDLEGVLDLLCEQLSGSILMSNIRYEVVRNTGNTLFVRVTAQPDPGEVTFIEEQDLPEIDWDVQICRVGFGFNNMCIKAKTEAEAIARADSAASNLEYSEKSSDYSFEACRA